MDSAIDNVLKKKNCNVIDSESPSKKRIKLDRSLSSHSVLSDTNGSPLEISSDNQSILEEMGLDCIRPDFRESLLSPSSLSSSILANGSSSYDEDTTTSSCDKPKENTIPNLKKTLSKINRIFGPPIDTENHFEKLSDEIIIMIFRWLPKTCLVNCSLVCKRWSLLSEDDTLWTKIDCYRKNLAKGDLGRILSKKPIFLRLAASEFPEPSILPEQKFNNSGFYLRIIYLDLSSSRISKSTLALILQKCYRLRKLSLASCVIDENICSRVSNMYRTLEVLNLAMAQGINYCSITALFHKPLTRLKELNLSWTDLSSESILFVCQHLPSSLDRFNFSGCKRRITNHHVKIIVENTPNLRELDLSDCTQLRSSIFNEIVQLKQLNFLALSRCYEIKNIDVKKLELLPHLKYLDIHGMNSLMIQFNDAFCKRVEINKFLFSSVARPTVGNRSSTIWGVRIPN